MSCHGAEQAELGANWPLNFLELAARPAREQWAGARELSWSMPKEYVELGTRWPLGVLELAACWAGCLAAGPQATCRLPQGGRRAAELSQVIASN